MSPNPIHRLPAPLEAAVQRLKKTAREAAERTVESLGIAALGSSSTQQRDTVLAAQFELHRKLALFVLRFNDTFDQRILKELAPRGSSTTVIGGLSVTEAPLPTNWSSLSLVDDREVEAQISSERFSMEIAAACEWELRELEGYVVTLLVDAGGERERNPLDPKVLGQAVLSAVDTVSDRPELRAALANELSRSLSSLLRSTYAQIVSDLRHAGVQPVGLTVLQRQGGGSSGGADSALGAMSQAPGPGSSRQGPMSTHPSVFEQSRHSTAGPDSHVGTPLGQVDPVLMKLMRRLAYSDEGFDTASRPMAGIPDSGARSPLPNLIHAHREELRQVSHGALDHMVIDVIGFLFDQILADPKVPPQMARLLARLQLPVLRAALGDPSFFSSRKHPVRRFVNRIASLGAAFEDFDDDAARDFLSKVHALVEEVVEGEFDQIEIYQHKLAALEAFVAEQAERGAAADGGAAELLQAKEDEYRLRQLYAERLAGELKDVTGPSFVRDFLSGVWSQVLLSAAAHGGPEGPLAQKLRGVGRELVLSVQPKPTPVHRKAFLAELPKLMQGLTEGMNLIAWPEAQRRAFFGQLMPAHAEALKSAPVRQLDLNLMAKQVEGALQRPLPSPDEVRAQPLLPVLDDVVAPPTLSAEEARRVGLVDESAVNWNGTVDIDLSADAGLGADLGAPAGPGLPAMTDAPEPTQGRELVNNIQIGFAYQMHLKDQWEKVRLAHVSPGRSFFMFTHGKRHKETVSLTHRMLTRLCETGRLRAFEQSTLIERATERARRQLATLTARAPRGAKA